MYVEVTKDIIIEAEPIYVPEASHPKDSYYFFSYKIRIRNKGNTRAQLISRHWIITDGNGIIQEVKGPGVVGIQPVLGPGEEFEYSSFCPLNTPVGNMRGTYQMINQEQEQYDVRIPLFFLRDFKSLH